MTPEQHKNWAREQREKLAGSRHPAASTSPVQSSKNGTWDFEEVSDEKMPGPERVLLTDDELHDLLSRRHRCQPRTYD